MFARILHRTFTLIFIYSCFYGAQGDHNHQTDQGFFSKLPPSRSSPVSPFSPVPSSHMLTSKHSFSLDFGVSILVSNYTVEVLIISVNY